MIDSPEPASGVTVERLRGIRRELAGALGDRDPATLGCLDQMVAQLIIRETSGPAITRTYARAVRSAVDELVAAPGMPADVVEQVRVATAAWWRGAADLSRCNADGVLDDLSSGVELVMAAVESSPEAAASAAWRSLRSALIAHEAEWSQAMAMAVQGTVAALHESGRHEAPLAADAVQAHLRVALDDDHLQVDDVQSVAGVHSREVYFVDAHSGEGAPLPLVIRRDRPLNITLTSVADEAGIMRDLARHGLPVPEVVSSGAAELDRPFLVMQRVPGRSMPVAQLPSPAVNLDQGARLLAQLHALPTEHLSWPGARHETPMERWSELLAEHDRWWREIRPRPSSVMERARQWLAANVEAVGDTTTVVHGDFNCKNFLIDEAGDVAWLIDFEITRLGHPAEDIASIRRDVEQVMPRQRFVDVYQDAGGSKLTDAALQFCDVWILYRNVMVATAADYAFRSGRSVDPYFGIAGLTYVPALTAHLVAALERVGAIDEVRANGNTPPR
jgi:aminoglycoside phosphotransferase (APT) family kinase protein